MSLVRHVRRRLRIITRPTRRRETTHNTTTNEETGVLTPVLVFITLALAAADIHIPMAGIAKGIRSASKQLNMLFGCDAYVASTLLLHFILTYLIACLSKVSNMYRGFDSNLAGTLCRQCVTNCFRGYTTYEMFVNPSTQAFA
jgi:hypothetical protein